jgi:hypothetical protein
MLQYRTWFIIKVICITLFVSCKKGGQKGVEPIAFDDSEFNCGAAYYYDSIATNVSPRYISLSGGRNIYFAGSAGAILKTDCDGNTIWQNQLNLPDDIIDFKAELNGDGFYVVTVKDSLVNTNDSMVCYQSMVTCTKSIINYYFDAQGPEGSLNKGGKLKLHKYDKDGVLQWKKEFPGNKYQTGYGSNHGSAIGLTNSGIYVLTYNAMDQIPVQNFTINPSSSIPYFEFADDQNSVTIRYLDLNGNLIDSQTSNGIIIKSVLQPPISLGVSRNRVSVIIEGVVHSFDTDLNFKTNIFPFNSNTGCEGKTTWALCNYKSDHSHFFGTQTSNNMPQYNYFETYFGAQPIHSRVNASYDMYPFAADDLGNVYHVNDSSFVKESSNGQVLYLKKLPSHLIPNTNLSRMVTVKNNQPFFFLANQFYIYIMKPNEIGIYR